MCFLQLFIVVTVFLAITRHLFYYVSLGFLSLVWMSRITGKRKPRYLVIHFRVSLYTLAYAEDQTAERWVKSNICSIKTKVYILGHRCVYTRLGLDYRGTLNESATGRPCISWKDGFKSAVCGTEDAAIFPLELCQIAEELYQDHNHCRSIPASYINTAKLYCFVDEFLIAECAPPEYCGKWR